jgi:ribose-phosphate pyrophosphokinase
MPTSLPAGILACPGAHHFAQQIVQHLEILEEQRFYRECKKLALAYGLTQEQAVQQYNLLSDMSSVDDSKIRDAHSYRKPNFYVRSRFTRFANGEVKTEILHGIRERDIYIVQDVYSEESAEYYGNHVSEYSVNDHLMTLLTAVDAVKGAGPARITCVLPAYPYARQHKRKGREGLSAALVGRMLEDMGVDGIFTLDIHSRDIDNAFQFLKLDSLHASYEIIRALLQLVHPRRDDLVVVAPDTGAVDRNKYYANSLGCPLAMLYKERDYGIVTKNAGETNIRSVRMLGDVTNKVVFLVDDMLGTGGTLIKALEIVKQMGASKVIIGISLPLFTNDAIDRFAQAYQKGLFYRLISTNAVMHKNTLAQHEWYVPVDVSMLFADAIVRVHNHGSLSPLLDNSEQMQKLIQDHE